MSPLVSAPARGYPDWQRIDNYDTPVEWSQTLTSASSPINSPALDTSRFAYLGGYIQCTAGTMLVLITWCADQALTTQLGSRRFVLSGSIGALAQLRLPNLGPFVQITVQSAAGGSYTVAAQVILTNRVHPLEFIPENALLIDQQGTTLGANATVTTFIGDYYAGPVSMFVSSGQIFNVTAQYITITGATHAFFQEANQAANVAFNFGFVAPPGAWNVAVANTTAVATVFFLAVTPSVTGSI